VFVIELKEMAFLPLLKKGVEKKIKLLIIKKVGSTPSNFFLLGKP